MRKQTIQQTICFMRTDMSFLPFKKLQNGNKIYVNKNLGQRCFLSFLVCQAYASGCDVVILVSGFTRVQVIPGSLYGYKEVSCIDCCDSDGKVLFVSNAPV